MRSPVSATLWPIPTMPWMRLSWTSSEGFDCEEIRQVLRANDSLLGALVHCSFFASCSYVPVVRRRQQMKVADSMTPKPVHVTPDDTLSTARSLMDLEDFRCLPVI